MSAVRLARGFTRRDKIIKFAGCYHGHSRLAPRSRPAPAPSPTAIPTAPASPRQLRRARPRRALQRRPPPSTAAFAANPGQIAGVILEPYIGNVGFIQADARLPASTSRQLTAQHGAVLIFDEVMTGFRLARGGVQELEEIVPTSRLPRAKSSAAACPSAPSAAAPTSWTTSPRLGPVVPGRHALAATRSPWPPASPSSACSTKSTPTPRSTPSAAKSAPPPSPPRKAKGLPLQSSAGAAPCSASSSRRPGAATCPAPLAVGRQALRPLLPRLPRRRRLPAPERIRGLVLEHRPRGSGH